MLTESEYLDIAERVQRLTMGDRTIPAEQIQTDLVRLLVDWRKWQRLAEGSSPPPKPTAPSSELRDLRQAAGLSQSAAAKLVGVDESSIRRWEAAKPKTLMARRRYQAALSKLRARVSRKRRDSSA